jgi:uncharacterized repeat protein (TIGR03803 family)
MSSPMQIDLHVYLQAKTLSKAGSDSRAGLNRCIDSQEKSMRTQNASLTTAMLTAVIACLLISPTRAASQTETALYSFGAYKNDGAVPAAALVFDSTGNLFGTTLAGGVYGLGSVFELSPAPGGGWTEKVIHSFSNNGRDGATPVASLLLDSAGNLYGTTQQGGTGSCTLAYTGCGTVFELTPKVGGGWTEIVLHSFQNSGKDGQIPVSNLIFDSAGNLYGTTSQGGIAHSGTVFELTPKTGGGWRETLVHSFGNNGKDGQNPEAGVLVDASGNLYGTTAYGGADGVGTVFEFMPKAGAGWTEKLLYTFTPGGQDVNGVLGLAFDSGGNLFGTTVSGGVDGNGSVFELSPAPGGRWTETLPYSFVFGSDGQYPEGSPTFDALGNVYGTTYDGGVNGEGTVYRLTPSASGTWSEEIFYSFNITGTVGAYPASTVIFDNLGNMYGTTTNGGAHGKGVVFEITP